MLKHVVVAKLLWYPEICMNEENHIRLKVNIANFQAENRNFPARVEVRCVKAEASVLGVFLPY